MSVKKIIGIVILVIIGGIGLLIFVLYATIKTKSTNLNKYKPFSEWVGKTVTLRRETVMFREYVPMNANREYPYMLVDSLHPEWELVQERKKIAEPDLEEIKVFPAGTVLKMEKAIQYTNGVSGSSYPTIFGTITAFGHSYKIGYRWGEAVGGSFDRDKKRWEFNQAPWQVEKDTALYIFPIADVW